jgi:phenol 2-monooxygenase
MQFYLNGYRPGDPLIEDPHPAVAERAGGLPENVDVLIVGCGPAGLVLAAQMAAFPDVRTAAIDHRNGPLEVGLIGSSASISRCCRRSDAHR